MSTTNHDQPSLDELEAAFDGLHLEEDDSIVGRIEQLRQEWKEVCTLCGHGPIHLDYISAAESVRELIAAKDEQVSQLQAERDALAAQLSEIDKHCGIDAREDGKFVTADQEERIFDSRHELLVTLLNEQDAKIAAAQLATEDGEEPATAEWWGQPPVCRDAAGYWCRLRIVRTHEGNMLALFDQTKYTDLPKQPYDMDGNEDFDCVAFPVTSRHDVLRLCEALRIPIAKENG